ncbi:MAG: cytochrome c biogenesis protein CcdA [Eggerthellaceae bacterium]|nr:cytochrome c biogenesis protein CcdA [Eggerthellaceae bacterium]
MDFVITFLEGVVTFVSPCLLPMLPIYIAYFAGGAGGEGGESDAGVFCARGEGGAANAVGMPGVAGADDAVCVDRTGSKAGATPAGSAKSAHTRRTVTCALGFVCGFSLLFVVMGAFAAAVGSLFLRYQVQFNLLCGGVVIVLGLNYLGILRIPILQRTFKPKADVVPRGFASSFLFGMVFAVGWTPCVGAFLGSALSLAASSAHAGHGVALLLCYSLGLGLPFVLAAVLIDQLEQAFSWVKQHYDAVNKVCGVLLVVVGVLMATGTLGAWLNLLS